MAHDWDAIVIGAGPNGLAAAAALGRAGRSVLLVDRSQGTGGEGRSTEFAPGFQIAPLASDPGWLPPAVARGLGLEPVRLAEPEIPASVVLDRGDFLSLPRDPARAAEAIRRLSPADAERWSRFTGQLRGFARVLEALYQLPAPDIDTRAIGELSALLRVGLTLRGLGREAMIDFLRVLPMSVRDLLDDWFECEPLKAAVGAGGVVDIRQGPRSGGTAFVLLHHLTGASSGVVRGRPYPAERPEAVVAALERQMRQQRVAVRTVTGVAQVLIADDRVAGIALVSGEEISAPVVVSTLDPVRTLLDLVDSVWLDPEFLHAVRQIKLRGSRSTVTYALDALPELPGLSQPELALAGVVSLTSDLTALERAFDAAKYGRISDLLHVEFTVPTLRWPGLAPPGKQVLVAHARWTPYQLRDSDRWDPPARAAVLDGVTAAIGAVAPGFADRVLEAVLLTPADMEERYGASEGAISHGELTLDQILFMRPVAGWSRHAMPIPGLYLGGAGTHPGPGVVGGPGWLAARRVLDD